MAHGWETKGSGSPDYMRLERRSSTRGRTCRCCDVEIPKGQMAVQWWAGFNRGTIVICDECVARMHKMVSDG